MKELAESVGRAIDSPMDASEVLQKAARKWAAYSLDTYSGELLDASLNISKALANFTALLEVDNA